MQENLRQDLRAELRDLWKNGQEIWSEYLNGKRKFPEAVCVEYGKTCTLHRGYYCPSPIQDIVIGNNKRGPHSKTLRPEWAAGWYFRYAFDENRDLMKVESIGPGWTPIPEYLFRVDDTVWGIQVEGTHIRSVSREVYWNGRIKEYTLATVSSAMLCQIKKETYEYDDMGLCGAALTQLEMFDRFCQRPAPFLDETAPSYKESLFRGAYRFERADGFLVSYTARSGYNDSFNTARAGTYPVLLRRKA